MYTPDQLDAMVRDALNVEVAIANGVTQWSGTSSQYISDLSCHVKALACAVEALQKLAVSDHPALETRLPPMKLYAKCAENGWTRFECCSIWEGPHITLIVLTNRGDSELWKWTARGYREPDGETLRPGSWCAEGYVSREKAERAALEFYLEKE